MDTEKTISLAPDQILTDNNSRYSLLAVDDLKASIAEYGSIHTPIEVEPLSPPVDGIKYRLTVGFRRHKAATELNKESGGGIMLPAFVRPMTDDLTRLKRQLSENIDRRSLSPMDQAVAIKKLKDAGMSRLLIREMFKRPGGKKGTQSQPASNAWVNMTLSFLDLPKDIREKIHTGAVGVAAAYELTKVDPERRAEVLARAEKEREAAIAREEKDEAKYLETESKLAETEKTVEETASKLDLAKAEVELSTKALEAKQEEAQAAYLRVAKAKDKDAKKQAEEAFKAAEADARGLEKKVGVATKALDKLTETQTKVQTTAEELRARLEESRKATKGVGKPKAKAVGSGDVKKAAKESGASTGAVALSLADIRKLVLELSLPGTYPKVSAIGAAIKEAFEGVTTPGQLLKKLATITGEAKSAAKK